MFWIALVGLAVAVLSGAGSQILSGVSARIRGPLLNLASEIARKISSNNALKEKFLNAYQDKNSRKLTSLMYGIGFGPRSASLEKELANDKEEMLEVIDKINQENVKLENLANNVNSAAANTGTIGGNSQASATLDNARNELESINNSSDLNQNINGGTI